MRGNKFGSRKKANKPTLDGYTFDSNPEYYRYIALKAAQKHGAISGLIVHPKYILAKGIKNEHGQHIYQWSYSADFEYIEKGGKRIVEDVKSLRVDRRGKKHGTSQSRDYKLTRNEFMRQNPDVCFIETY
jgi:uncharacterized protein DUF1064